MMSVMTAGEQRRRAGATRGRPPAAGAPGQQTVTAGEARAGVARNGAARPETALARPVRTRARLTRRGRVVVAALITACVVLVAALAWLAGTARAEAAGSGSPASAVYHSLRSVVVQPG